jgi:NADH:ubiquinone oxidoreductase subunit 6 (subunit J)
MEATDRLFYGLVGLASLAAIAACTWIGGGAGAAFGLFAVLVIAGSLTCIWERSVVRSAFCLIGTFGGTAGLFLMLGSDFLAMSQILIYVGGILALILFGVMLTPPD